MTAKTRNVRIQPRRNREPNATAVTTMASSTSSARVLRVIEPCVEAAQWGEGFDLSALNVRVTNRADLTCRI